MLGSLQVLDAIILAQNSCFRPAPLTAALAMTNLEGVADEWEDSRDLRKYVRLTKKLIKPLLGDDAVHITAKTAGVNRSVLTPLVMRLKDHEQGTITMCTLPEIRCQTLSQTYVALVVFFGKPPKWAAKQIERMYVYKKGFLWGKAGVRIHFG